MEPKFGTKLEPKQAEGRQALLPGRYKPMKITRWKQITKPADLVQLDGIETTVTYEGITPSGITLTDVFGESIHIGGDYCGIKLFVPGEVPTVKKYRVAGVLLGDPYQKDFESKWEADNQARKVNDVDGADVTVSEVEVPEDDQTLAA